MHLNFRIHCGLQNLQHVFFLKNVVFFGYFGFSIFFPCFRAMARTRGGRERPKASVRRGDRHDEAAEAGGFPGGPSDRSVLVSYPNHIAFRLWTGEVRYLQFPLLCW